MNYFRAAPIVRKSYIRYWLLAFFPVVAGFAVAESGQSQSSQPSQQRATPAVSRRVPVVLELFTSEGCSSCPPADGLLAKLDEQQPVAGAEIIGLEEHVDYWDHQGWVDPFSSAQWTQRQQAYASELHDHGVYTPELVVNGKTAFVGSREGEAYRAVATAATQAQTEIVVALLRSEKAGHEGVKIDVGKLQGGIAGDPAQVWLVLAESSLHSEVSAGENAGHQLHHAPVVRWLHKAGTADVNKAPSFTGESELKLDSAWKRNNLRLVAFVQQKHSRQILGATSVRFQP